MNDSAMFLHLRKHHGASSAGRKVIHSPTDMTDLLIEMTSVNIRELMFRAIKVKFTNLVQKFKSLHIFEREAPVLFSKRIHKLRLKTHHVIVVKIPDDIVTPQLIERSPFNVPIDLFPIL